MTAQGEIIVSVAADGRYTVNRKPVDGRSVELLAAELASAAGGSNEMVVIVSADATAAHQSVINVMDAARRANLPHLTFATQTSAGGGKPRGPWCRRRRRAAAEAGRFRSARLGRPRPRRHRPRAALSPGRSVRCSPSRGPARAPASGGLRRNHHLSVTRRFVVGNLIAGGAGKTPVVMALVETLRLRGHSPGIVSRGYGHKDDSVRQLLVTPTTRRTARRR